MYDNALSLSLSLCEQCSGQNGGKLKDQNLYTPMIKENRELVTDEPVELEK